MLKKYLVYHCINETEMFREDTQLWQAADRNYQLVAEVEAAGLAEVFRLTNHIDYAWTENAGARLCSNGPVRSTSVGDVITLGEDAWLVTGSGFVPLYSK